MRKKIAGVQSDNNTSVYDWHKINVTHHAKYFLCQHHTTKTRVCMIICPVLCLSDGLCCWGQAERRSGGLERSGSLLLLPWGGPGGHWGVPAGALTGGAACTHACFTSDHRGATNTRTLPTGHQDHRLVLGRQWKRWQWDDVGACIFLYFIYISFIWLYVLWMLLCREQLVRSASIWVALWLSHS